MKANTMKMLLASAGILLPATAYAQSADPKPAVPASADDTQAVLAAAAEAAGGTFIDAGSTNAAVAMALSPDINITVVTNSIVVLGLHGSFTNAASSVFTFRSLKASRFAC